MTDMTHEIQVSQYKTIPSSIKLGTFDSYGTEKIHFAFGPGWENLAVYATFTAPNGKSVQTTVDLEGSADVPPEATAEQAGQGEIVLVGKAEGVNRITVSLHYTVLEHGPVQGTEPAVPTPDLLQQVLTLSRDAQAAAKNAEQSAKNAVKDATDTVKPYKEESVQAATAAALSEKNAAESKATAQEAAERATQAGIAASNAAEEAERSAGIATDAAGGSELNAENAHKSALNAQRSANNAAESQSVAAASAASAERNAEQAATDAKTATDAKVAADGSADAAAGSAVSAVNSASAAARSEQAAAQSAATADKRATDAEAAKQAAAQSAAAADKRATDAEAAKQAAAQSAATADKRATDAEAAKQAAAQSAAAADKRATDAAKSAADADSTANSINVSMAQISKNTEAVSQLKDDKANKADVLSLEEIQASTNLDYKIASAESAKMLLDRFGYIQCIHDVSVDINKSSVYTMPFKPRIYLLVAGHIIFPNNNGIYMIIYHGYGHGCRAIPLCGNWTAQITCDDDGNVTITTDGNSAVRGNIYMFASTV